MTRSAARVCTRSTHTASPPFSTVHCHSPDGSLCSSEGTSSSDSRSPGSSGENTHCDERKNRFFSLNVPITCGGVVVQPGDMVVADEIGITVVPRDRLEETVKLAREQAQREQTTRDWVAKGKTVEDLLAEFGRI